VDDFLKRPPVVKVEKSPRKRSSSGAEPDTKKKQVKIPFVFAGLDKYHLLGVR
jgi:hypothetical protein